MHRAKTTSLLQRLRLRRAASWLPGGAHVTGEPQPFPSATIVHLHCPAGFNPCDSANQVAGSAQAIAYTAADNVIRVLFGQPPLGPEPAPDAA
ncbi:MAG: hypothetical protein QM691_09300 [Opitutaceae bacterium]